MRVSREVLDRFRAIFKDKNTFTPPLDVYDHWSYSTPMRYRNRIPPGGAGIPERSNIMSHTIRTTSASIIIESDGIDPAYGPSCTVQGAWVGKVSIPRAELTELVDELSHLPAFEWSPADSTMIERASTGALFAIVASGDWRAPKGSRRYGCHKIS